MIALETYHGASVINSLQSESVSVTLCVLYLSYETT
jgi:hypothetical protein